MAAEQTAHLRTVRDLIRYAVSAFDRAGLSFGHGTDNAQDEAAWLVLHSLRLPLDRLEPFLDRALSPAEIDAALSLIHQRIEKRLPAAYLTHEAWLGKFRFYVDERVIVPRSHIAELLREQLSPWITNPDAVKNCMDLCTGSGCLAILLAHAFPNAAVDATDISADVLEVARRNVSDYGLEQRIELHQCDLFGERNGQYEVIVSNPPYVDAETMATLPAEYRAEPSLALAGGEDGLDIIRRILDQAAAHLTPKGILVVEVGHDRPVLEQAYPDLPFVWLETRAGGDFVFLLAAGDLRAGSR
ncbi:MAG: 50S ribosomal protein L3 N(5)-glutamine methyltransferase [Betaproteobacteria bacterium]|nr:MAG: 50S ribosomal protein L3 N(5)-glutamine methyltransferase [Betaproteobacteria bacterium]